MAAKSGVKLPNIGNQIIQGAYGRQGKCKIKDIEHELLTKAKESEIDLNQNRAKRLRWDNLNRRK